MVACGYWARMPAVASSPWWSHSAMSPAASTVTVAFCSLVLPACLLVGADVCAAPDLPAFELVPRSMSKGLCPVAKSAKTKPKQRHARMVTTVIPGLPRMAPPSVFLALAAQCYG